MERICGAALGLVPGNSPLLVEALQSALEALRAKRGVTLCLEPGEYHFYPRHAPCRELCISNHDPEPRRPIAFLLEGFHGLCVNGGGSRFVFHTEILPFYIASSRGVRLENFSLDYARPAYSEGEILSVQPQEMMVRIDPAKYPWQVRQGRLVFWGENFCHPLHLWLELDAETGAPAWGTDDLYFRTARQTRGLDLCAEAIAPDLVRLTLSGLSAFLRRAARATGWFSVTIPAPIPGFTLPTAATWRWKTSRSATPRAWPFWPSDARGSRSPGSISRRTPPRPAALQPRPTPRIL